MYSHGQYSSDREKRLLEIQELAVNMLIENPRLTEAEIVMQLNGIIKEDEEKTRLLEKTLGYKFI